MNEERKDFKDINKFQCPNCKEQLISSKSRVARGKIVVINGSNHGNKSTETYFTCKNWKRNPQCIKDVSISLLRSYYKNKLSPLYNQRI